MNNAEPKIVFTKELPTRPGYYYWTNFGEHTPTVVQVRRDHSTSNLWAENDEFSFIIRKKSSQSKLNLFDQQEKCKETDGDDKHNYGDELWAYIPNPWLPNMTKQVELDSY
jgi:hypothetical protein